MKKLFAGFALMGAFVLASAQTITFDQTTWDYGTVKTNSDGHRMFTVKNTGDKPLIISSVKASCGCTTPEWSQDPIMPGKSSQIKVGYNTAINGPFVKTIEVFSNDPVNGRSALNIKGTVDPNAKEVVKVLTPAELKAAEKAKHIADKAAKKAAKKSKMAVKK
ncbi:MAG: DUF1573 domain-containing protein [Kaistella sp.]|nr:DUF1573 domain-containing protein [Kaistella sp.]